MLLNVRLCAYTDRLFRSLTSLESKGSWIDQSTLRQTFPIFISFLFLLKAPTKTACRRLICSFRPRRLPARPDVRNSSFRSARSAYSGRHPWNNEPVTPSNLPLSLGARCASAIKVEYYKTRPRHEKRKSIQRTH